MIVKKPMLVEDHQSEIKSPERPQEPLQKSRCLTTARMPFSEMIWDVTVTLGGWCFSRVKSYAERSQSSALSCRFHS